MTVNGTWLNIRNVFWLVSICDDSAETSYFIIEIVMTACMYSWECVSRLFLRWCFIVVWEPVSSFICVFFLKGHRFFLNAEAVKLCSITCQTLDHRFCFCFSVIRLAFMFGTLEFNI